MMAQKAKPSMGPSLGGSGPGQTSWLPTAPCKPAQTPWIPLERQVIFTCRCQPHTQEVVPKRVISPDASCVVMNSQEYNFFHTKTFIFPPDVTVIKAEECTLLNM